MTVLPSIFQSQAVGFVALKRHKREMHSALQQAALFTLHLSCNKITRHLFGHAMTIKTASSN